MPENESKDINRPLEGPGEENRSVFSYINPFHGRISLSEQLLFTKYFSTLTRAGISILRALSTLSRQMKTWRLRKMIWDMKTDVEGGMPLNVCFKRNEDVFGILYPNLIKVGEESGRLHMILERLSTLMERQIAIRRRVYGAMAYPAVIGFVAWGVMMFLLVFIIPQFTELFEQFDQELPWITQSVIDFSSFIIDNYLNIIAFFLTSALIVYQINNTDKGKAIIDKIKLSVPVFGTLIKKYQIAMYARNLSTLFESGINIITAMKISCDAVGNSILQRELLSVITEVEGGIPIAKAIARIKIMPELSTQMIEVGEESGNLDEMLERVAEFYEEEINFLIDQMTVLVEPIFIVVVGAVVGFIVLAMYLPIFRMARVVSGGIGDALPGG